MRKSQFSGTFYPSDKDSIINMFSRIKTDISAVKAKGVISPHAGYIYSGNTAYKTFQSVEIPETCIILCPNHRGIGEALSVNLDDAWDTPFGKVPVDRETALKVIEFFGAKEDSLAHIMEHSLEVQLPILKMIRDDVKICPVSIGTGDRDILTAFAEHISSFYNPETHIMIASSDMSHFISAREAEVLDMSVVDCIKSLDPEAMFDTVRNRGISMCGVYPAFVMLKTALNAGAKHAEVIEYTHSGNVTGDMSDVVAYLGMRIF